jgi:hypothetical protein
MMEHVAQRTYPTAGNLLKAFLYAPYAPAQALYLRLYIRHKRGEGYRQLIVGRSRFYGPTEFIAACREAVELGIEKDRGLLEPLITQRGIVMFPEDPLIGYLANDKYRHLSVSKEYFAYGAEGIVALMVYIAFRHKYQVRIGRWETGIPTSSRKELLENIGQWLKAHDFHDNLVEPCLPRK